MSKILSVTHRLYRAVLLLTLLVILLCVILQIISRYIFNTPFSWTEEISLFAFCWFTFMGSAVCSYEKTHLEVDFFYNRLHGRVRRILRIIILTLVILLEGVMVVIALWTMTRQQGISSVAARLPVSLYTLAVVLGFLGMGAFTTYHLFRDSSVMSEPEKQGSHD